MTDPTTDSSNQTPWAIGLRWLLGQPFNNVLTFLLLLAIAYGTYLGAPQVIEEVRRQRSDFTEELKAQRSEFLQSISQSEERCSKAIEREHQHGKELFERAFGRRADVPPVPHGPPITAKGGS